MQSDLLNCFYILNYTKILLMGNPFLFLFFLLLSQNADARIWARAIKPPETEKNVEQKAARRLLKACDSTSASSSDYSSISEISSLMSTIEEALSRVSSKECRELRAKTFLKLYKRYSDTQ